jgi:hypothetical protein
MRFVITITTNTSIASGIFIIVPGVDTVRYIVRDTRNMEHNNAMHENTYNALWHHVCEMIYW